MIQIKAPQTSKAATSQLTQASTYTATKQAKSSMWAKPKASAAESKATFQVLTSQQKHGSLSCNIRSIDWIVVNNEVEALLLENKLIKQHTPKYNIDLKDAKSYAYISLTREPFPRLLMSRKVSRKLESFGPYTEGFTRQDLQRTVVRVFKLRTCKTMHKRACLNYHIHLCTAPCVEKVTAEQYNEQVKQTRSFLNGNYEKTIEQLNAQMQAASANQKFEEALELRNQIASIRLLTQHQIVDNERRFDQDIMVFVRLARKCWRFKWAYEKAFYGAKTSSPLICSLRLNRNS